MKHMSASPHYHALICQQQPAELLWMLKALTAGCCGFVLVRMLGGHNLKLHLTMNIFANKTCIAKVCMQGCRHHIPRSRGVQHNTQAMRSICPDSFCVCRTSNAHVATEDTSFFPTQLPLVPGRLYVQHPSKAVQQSLTSHWHMAAGEPITWLLRSPQISPGSPIRKWVNCVMQLSPCSQQVC